MTVGLTTLDALVTRFGEPAFCKIDVEGFDLEVLQGLSRPLRALSFECVPPAADLALACMDRLRLARSVRIQFLLRGVHETLRDELDRNNELALVLRGLPSNGPCGDVYARPPDDVKRCDGGPDCWQRRQRRGR